MARYRGPVCRLCRREGMKLFLKGERCFGSEVRHREAEFRARCARQDAAEPHPRLRASASREAEGQTHLRATREAVPALLRARRADRAALPVRCCCSRSSGGWTIPSTDSGSRHRVRRRGFSFVTATFASESDGSISPRIRFARETSSRWAPSTRSTTNFQHATDVAKSRGVPKWLEFGVEGTSGKVVSLAQP